MKITVVAKSGGWHQRDLERAAKERGAELEVLDIKSVQELPKKSQRFGDAIIWRSTSGIDSMSERTATSLYFGDTPVLNIALFERPFTAYKYYQQAVFAKHAPRNCKGIKTYRAASPERLQRFIDTGKLKYPFIAKPNLGSKGQGIVVVEGPEHLEQILKHRDYIFQNFIKNDGDFRVIVVGGRALGVMRRIAKEGSFLNNISQGATSVNEERPQTYAAVVNLALYVASIFGLAYCGVDIIRDKTTKELHFMEVNTAPQWNGEFGFAAITGADVAGAIVDLTIDLAERKTTSTATLVQRYYDKHIQQFSSRAVHYASRLYLWTGDQRYREMLNAVEAEYMGKESAATEERLQKLFRGDALNPSNVSVPARADYFARYPMLQPANRLLFKVLFASTLYGRDIRPMVRAHVSDEQLLTVFNQLVHDQDAVRVLSTFALNYFYLLKYYFRDDLKSSNLVLLDPAFFENLLDGYDLLLQQGVLSAAEKMQLQIYLATHAIIGESQFYNRKVSGEGYRRLAGFVEGLIRQHYFDISLDCKNEFLVACRLTGYHTDLREVILGESAHSLSPIANLIVDTLNTTGSSVRARIDKAEHRNVLYLMATLPYRRDSSLPDQSALPEAAMRATQTVGRMAHVDFPDYGIVGVKARIDSGAFFSAVHASDIVENPDGTLSFTLLGGYHESIQGIRLVADEYRRRPVKNTSGIYEERYVVTLRTSIGHAVTTHTFTLADRKHMATPLLLGRTFLREGYVVDVSKQFA